MTLNRYKVKVAIPINGGKLMPGQIVSPEKFKAIKAVYEDRFELETAEIDNKNFEAYKQEGWFEANQKAGAEDDKEALQAEYEEVFGKKPHHFKSAEKLKAEIEAKRAEE